MIGIFAVAGFAMYQLYKPASTANQRYQQSTTTVKTTPPATPTETSPSQTVTPTTRPSATQETPTPNSTGKPAIIDYSIEIVMKYEGIPEAIFYIPTPDWNISYWGECGDLPGSKAIVNVHSMSWKGGPIQSITFNNTGGEHFIMHGGPGHFYLRISGVVCSPIEVTAFRFVSCVHNSLVQCHRQFPSQFQLKNGRSHLKCQASQMRRARLDSALLFIVKRQALL